MSWSMVPKKGSCSLSTTKDHCKAKPHESLSTSFCLTTLQFLANSPSKRTSQKSQQGRKTLASQPLCHHCSSQNFPHINTSPLSVSQVFISLSHSLTFVPSLSLQVFLTWSLQPH